MNAFVSTELNPQCTLSKATFGNDLLIERLATLNLIYNSQETLANNITNV